MTEIHVQVRDNRLKERATWDPGSLHYGRDDTKKAQASGLHPHLTGRQAAGLLSREGTGEVNLP